MCCMSMLELVGLNATNEPCPYHNDVNVCYRTMYIGM